MVTQAYEWCVNLGAPAALVAGAVAATLYETIRGGALRVRRDDPPMVRAAKTGTTLLLLSAFALQIVSIFVTTVTGTMLLSRDFSNGWTVAVPSALGFLEEHFEFEYLTSRLSFLQGLLHWLAGVAMESTITRSEESSATQRMDRFVSTSLTTLILILISFYNRHLTFYGNYAQILWIWLRVALRRFVLVRPTARPMMLLYGPGLVLSVVTGYRALVPSVTDEDDDDDDAPSSSNSSSSSSK